MVFLLYLTSKYHSIFKKYEYSLPAYLGKHGCRMKIRIKNLERIVESTHAQLCSNVTSHTSYMSNNPLFNRYELGPQEYPENEE